MKLFVTDSIERYQSSTITQKFLIEGAIIKQSSMFDSESIGRFNNDNNNIETEAGELMLAQLYCTIEKIGDTAIETTVFINRITDRNERLFALLYETFSVQVHAQYMFAMMIERMLVHFGLEKTEHILYNLENIELKLHKSLLPEKLRPVVFQMDKTSAVTKQTALWMKNVFFYTPYHLLKKIPRNKKNQPLSKRHILLVIYDVEHHFTVLRTFFGLVKNDSSIHLSVVVYPTGGEGLPDGFTEQHTAANIDIYPFAHFRKPLFKDRSEITAKILCSFDDSLSYPGLTKTLEDTQLKYRWMENIFKTLKPDTCLHMSTHEIGRIMANVSSFFKIPSVQADYALFSDWYTIESHIRYTARASINEAMITTWKKRKDPTPLHYAIGFCKLDNPVPPTIAKKDFLLQNGFDVSRRTLLFAGTWSLTGHVYDLEQEKIILALSEICHQQKLNFVIKKHPLDRLPTIEKVISSKNHSCQKVFRHDQLSIKDAIFYSDFVTNQMSSIVLECLFFARPFCFITSSENANQTEVSIIRNESFAPTIKLKELDVYIGKMMSNSRLDELTTEMTEKREQYLYKTDGNASGRLLDLLLSIQYR